MEMVGEYLLLELSKEKGNLELMINSLHKRMESNYRKDEFNIQNKIKKVFPLNRYEEGNEIIQLLEEVEQYLNSEKYEESIQKRLSIRLKGAIKTIGSI